MELKDLCNNVLSAEELAGELYEAVLEVDVKKVKLLIAKGVDVNAQTGDTYKRVEFIKEHRAVYWFFERLLTRQGRNRLEVYQSTRDTALHIAAMFNNHEIAEILLDAGADFNLKNKMGDSPLEIAEKFNSEKILELIKRY